jgi:4-hydroxy-4-methyl-2-oxoglutarate aldolase
MNRTRHVLTLPGIQHGAPIPLGVRIGNLIWTSAMMGMDPSTSTIPDDPDRQVALAFDNLAALLDAGGSSIGQIAHATVFLADNEQRERLNRHWTTWYPEEEDRPARHAIVGPLPQNVVLQLEVMAVADRPLSPRTVDDSLLARVARRSTATLHEASGGRGYVSSTILPLRPGMRLCGPALPVRCAPGDNGWIHRALYAPEAPGSVLVVDVGDGREFGYWGAVLTEAAMARGVTGLVIDGGVRDADEIAALGFPVFSAGVSIRGTVKDPAAAGSVGAPVHVGHSQIALGDLIVGDGDGLVVIERATAEEVVASAIERDEKEAGYIEQLRRGVTTLDLFSIEPPIGA